MYKKTLAMFITLALLVGALSVAGIAPVSAGTISGYRVVGFDGSTAGILTGTNLLAGMEGTLGGSQSISEGQVGLVTDGSLPGVSAESTGKIDINMWSGYGWASLAYTLDSPTAIDRLMVCSGVTDAAYRLYYIRVTAANTLEELNNTDCLVAEYHGEFDGSAPQAILMTLNQTITVQYIRFSFFVPGSDITGSTPWWSCARVGEVGAYCSVRGGSYSMVDSVPEDTNMLAGRDAALGSSQSVGKGSTAMATDGILLNNSASELDINMWSGYGWAELSYALDETTVIDRILVSSYTDYRFYQLYSGRVYISDTRAGLIDEKNLAASFDFGVFNGFGTMLLTLDQPTVGKYIRFTFFVPGSDVTGSSSQWYGCARIGEVAAYGTAASDVGLLVSEGAQLRDYKTGASEYAMRFGFSLDCSDVTCAAVGDYTRDLTNGTVAIGNKNFAIVDMGCVVTSKDSAVYGETLDLNDVDSAYTVKIPANKLYSVAADSVTYTGVIVHIPAARENHVLHTVPYLQYQTPDGVETIYGTMLDRSVSGLRASQ